MTLVKLFFFALSTLGSFELLRLAGRDRIQTHFLPSLTIAVQVSVLFLAGLWNLLPEAAGILYLLGFSGLFLLVIREKSLNFLRKYADFGYAALLMILMGSALAVKGKMFLQYDNFSHWALVVREMLRFDRFPNFTDTLIHFQEYPWAVPPTSTTSPIGWEPPSRCKCSLRPTPSPRRSCRCSPG